MGITAAFFDIDGTIYREGLITEVFKKLIKHEIINPMYWRDDVRKAYLNWDKRQGEYDDYLDRMVDIYNKSILGIEDVYIKNIAKKVVEQKGDRVYVFTRNQINWHKEHEHKTFAISGSPEELVKEMSGKYQFDDYRGTIYVTDNDSKYTEEIVPMWDSDSKLKAIREICDQYNVDLEKSYAYGDTTGDYAMMCLVGHPFAINPTKALLKKIREDKELSKKIKIIVERKDVIYKMDIDNINQISI